VFTHRLMAGKVVEAAAWNERRLCSTSSARAIAERVLERVQNSAFWICNAGGARNAIL
jgi:hypothetical protein